MCLARSLQIGRASSMVPGRSLTCAGGEPRRPVPVVSAEQLERQVEASRRQGLAAVRVSVAAARRPPPRRCFSSRAWVIPTGISSTWWVTSTEAGAYGSGPARRGSGPAPRGRPGRDRPPARRAAAARGRSSAPGRSAPACAPPRSGCRRCGRPGPSIRSEASSSVGPLVVQLVVRLPPPADAPRTRRRRPRRAPARPAGSARPARPRSARSAAAARRRRPCRAPRPAARRRRPWGGSGRRATCSSVVLPAPFGPDDHPAVGLVDGPGDVGDQGGSAADDGHPGEVDDCRHGRQPIVRVTQPGAASRTVWRWTRCPRSG